MWRGCHKGGGGRGATVREGEERQVADDEAEIDVHQEGDAQF